ncbi:MAG: plastocyanin/azurin family copper-binding protein [Balneolales bacterium]
MINLTSQLKALFGIISLALFSLVSVESTSAVAQQASSPETSPEISTEDYYQVISLRTPDDLVLEVGGLVKLPNGKLAVTTRRGEVWIIGNPEMEGGRAPYYTRFARGLYEPLGLKYKDGSFYTSQRGELTKLTDTSGDGKADLYERVSDWPISSHYHEYSFGPAFLPDGDMVVTGNVAFGGDTGDKWWEATSFVPWRGWAMIISPEGELKPFATGLRSPSGIMVNDQGDVLYTENQGDWIGSGHITHLEEGDFAGNPAGLVWADHPDSPVTVRKEEIIDSERPMFESAEKVPGMKLPAVWIPHTLMGISTSDLIQDVDGTFSPYKGQYFVGDQGHARINRVFMEKVGGEYQGATFPFLEDFDSGVLRMAWGGDKSMYVGMTDRGWNSTGDNSYGLQRVVWNGKIPFEMKTITAEPDGFRIEFTEPVNKTMAANPALYNITNFTYMYRYEYGSPVINQENAPVKGIQVADDGLSVRLVVDNLRKYHVHEVRLGDIRSASGTRLLHDVGYYTLNNIPSGALLSSNEYHSVDWENNELPVITSLVSMEPELEEETGEEAEAPAIKRMTEMPLSWENGPDESVRLGTEPGLKYDMERIEVVAGSKVELTFSNDDNMLHNVVIVKPETADNVGQMAMNLGLQGGEMHYVPDTDEVLFNTAVLQPNSSETIYFNAPDQPGTYTYVCTFPGHHLVMRGTLVVK